VRPDLQVERVRSSYTQVAEQLRDLIVRGDLAPGHRLPSEAEMAPLFGVSRSTIREALRILVTDGLVVTKRGVRGGTFVVEVDPGHVEGMLSSTLDLLAVTNQVGSDDFLDAWQAIEAPAARLAASRADQHDIDQLLLLCEPVGQDATRRDVLAQSADFHFTVLHASGNLLLEAMGRPVSAVARARFSQTTPTRKFWNSLNDEHRGIANAIGRGDAARAHEATVAHIEGLRAYYSAQQPEAARPAKRAASPVSAKMAGRAPTAS
jgi:GntR family transcriptional regulator, transcriptional repressor for pyruvate dehydrogenase complex